MTPGLILRPVVVLVMAVGLNGCGAIDSDPHRFENLAASVAAIELDSGRPAPVRTAAEAGLRPALRVEVMDPHALWDARDGLDVAVERAAPRLVAAAAPAVADALVQQVSTRIDTAASRAGLRPARIDPLPTSRGARPSAGLVQLGAYSSEASARSAWTRLRSGEAAWALKGLAPVYEGVEVGGRHLTRLKVPAPAAGAAAVCAAAGIDDPWCHRVA
jgi:hypothetical protein